jgi:hypothetical protein
MLRTAPAAPNHERPSSPLHARQGTLLPGLFLRLVLCFPIVPSAVAAMLNMTGSGSPAL